jgi:hypothetical protein
VDHHFQENLTPERVDAILDGVRGAPAAEGHAGRPHRAGGSAAQRAS